ncbi:MAG: DMT family transporter [Rhizobiales bacterium]|nr:DMT family transporter [Hyphomicrobiales bacterium]
MLGAMLILPSMDIIAKYVSANIVGVQVAQARFGFQMIVLLPAVLAWHGVGGLLPNNLWLNTVRSVLMAGAIACFFTALRWMPVADAIAVFFLEPMILTVLSAVFLGEKVGWRRMLAVSLGFVGALIVVRPSYDVFGPVSLLPMLAALLFALYLMLTSKLSHSENILTMQFWSGFVGVVTLNVVMASGSFAGVEMLTFRPPTLTEWALMGLAGAIGTSMHLLIVQAFRLAPASVLAPLNYMEIVSATALGFLVFGDFPDALKWLRIAIIVGSGLFIFWRESKLAAKPKP